MDLIATILLPFYILFAFIVAWVIGELYYQHNSIKRFLLPALGLKIVGALAFAFIYTFYYGSGDTFMYFKCASIINEELLFAPSNALEILRIQAQVFTPYNLEILESMLYFKSESTWFVVKIIAILSVFGLKNYMLTTVLYCFLCFWGQWGMFRVFTKLFPKQTFYVFLACFAIPSVVFWCGGIMKDTLMLACVGASFYCIYEVFFKFRKILFCTPIFLWSLVAMFAVKFYIPLIFIPCLFIWIVLDFFSKFKNPYLKNAIILTVFAGSAIFIYLLNSLFSQLMPSLVSSLVGRAIGMQQWHGYLQDTMGGSGYSLGEIDFTLLGVVSKILPSVNVTFFRPYLWEVNSIVVLVASVESLLVSIFTLIVLIKIGLFRSLKILFSNPLLFSMFLYIFFFGFLVGFTSYNFGALVRYKTPCLPFFFMILFLLFKAKEVFPEYFKERIAIKSVIDLSSKQKQIVS